MKELARFLTPAGQATLAELRAAFEQFAPITTLTPTDQRHLTRILEKASKGAEPPTTR